MIPRLIVAAPASGSGKTTVATGLIAALTAQGLDVSPHKVGPDYIDPGYHTLAAGRPGRNLDPWLTSQDLVAPLFLHGARDADIAVVEGVMGLYDGAAGAGEFASTAHVAKLLNAPVVLVVDAASAGRSVAALVHGFVTYDPGVRAGGVILNRVGSDRHEEICRAAIEETGLPVFGVLRRRDDVITPSRHLGLIPVAERRPEAVATVERLGELVTASCDLRGLVALANTAGPLAAEPWTPCTAVGDTCAASAETGTAFPVTRAASAGTRVAASDVRAASPVTRGVSVGTGGVSAGAGVSAGRPTRIAIAGGPAFTFGYAENEELLAAAGAEVVRFDPLRDPALPPGTKGLIIGGGFPETYAAELSANTPLRREVAAFRGPIYAECAGLLYLARRLDDTPMCGMFDAEARMTSRLTLGYREAVAVRDSPVTRAGERVRGHEFHRTVVTRGTGSEPAWQWSADGPDGFTSANCLASYLHLHWAGTPQMATRFVGAAA